MCGIGGIIGQTPISRDALSRVARAVNHRGPDYTGLRLYHPDFTIAQDAGSIGIFHNRLSIIDLDPRSHQPFEDDRYLLVFNGEIYNFVELREELRALDHSFSTSSDTEVLFAALKQWGNSAILRLNGMFAFAFIDKTARRLLLARDRTGIKPLYYACSENDFSFASETDTILRLSRLSPRVDLRAAQHYRLFQYVPGARSIWSGIQKLLPGHYLETSLDTPGGEAPQPVKYWDAYIAAKAAKPAADLENLLSTAVDQQLVADVPLGVFLSSGVDSSLLAAIIRTHHRGANVGYFTVGFDDAPEHDESPKAADFLRQLGAAPSSFTRLPLNSDDVRNRWEELYRVVDEPFGDHAILLNWAVASKASEHVKVVLSGDGGDEIFAGYDRYRDWQGHQSWRRAGSINLIAIQCLAGILKKRGLAIRGESNPAVQYLMMLAPSELSAKDISEVLSQIDFSNGLEDVVTRRDLPRLIDMKSYLPDGMLYKVDRASMAASIEVRVPFLDNDVVAAGLAEGMFRPDKPLKWPLRELLGRLAPHYDLQAPKQGFSFPLHRWMREKWGGFLREIIYEGDRQALGIEDKIIFEKLKSFQEGDNRVGYSLWIEANLLLWHRHKQAQLDGGNRL